MEKKAWVARDKKRGIIPDTTSSSKAESIGFFFDCLTDRQRQELSDVTWPDAKRDLGAEVVRCTIIVPD